MKKTPVPNPPQHIADSINPARPDHAQQVAEPVRRGITTYFCRAHETRVNWRGTDCRECRNEHRDRQHKRETERQARRLAALKTTTK